MTTTLPFLKLFNSENNYFDQPREVLQVNREHIRTYLRDMKGYNKAQVSQYLAAYDYFVCFPLDFDGATMTEDLPDIGKLELCAMLHDYLYINFNCSGNFLYRWRVDKLFRNEMTRQNKGSWHRTVRFVLLVWAAFPHTPYTYLFKKRKMTYGQKISVDGILTVLNQQFPRLWHKEFRNEITFVVSLIILFTFILI